MLTWIKANQQRWGGLLKLTQLLWHTSRYDVGLLFSFGLLKGLLPLGIVIALQQFVDSALLALQQPQSFRPVVGWAIVLLAANSLYSLLSSADRWLGENLQEHLTAQLQAQLLHAASIVPLEYFEQPHTYDQLHRAQRGLEKRMVGTIQQLSVLPTTLVTITSLSIYLAQITWWIPLVLVCGTVPLVVQSTRHYVKRYMVEKTQTRAERQAQYSIEMLTTKSYAADVRVYNLQTYLLHQWEYTTRALRDERLDLAQQEARLLIRRTLWDRLLVGAVLGIVVTFIALGRITLSYFASYLSAVDHLNSAFYTLFWSFASTDTDLRYLQDIFDYLAHAEASQQHYAEQSPGIRLSENQGLTIEFNNVGYTYPNEQHARLSNISFELHSEEQLALVGANGAGKTTLTKLLLGLYKPTVGRITVNEFDLHTLDAEWWREKIAAVFQDFMCYEASVKDNIQFGHSSAIDSAALTLAIQQSDTKELIERLPDGIDTILGTQFVEHSQHISGGEWQKIALARAFYRQTPVMVLDEPTAALDPQAEVVLYRQFCAAVAGRTSLIISHRLGSARLADRILVLDQGRLVENGTFAQLMAAEGLFAELYALQAAWYA